MNREKLKKYAEVVVRRGIYIKPDQAVTIEAQLESKELVIALTEAAYNAGASEVDVTWNCDALERVHMLQDKLPTELSEAQLAKIDENAKKGAARILIETVDIDTFADVPAAQITKKAALSRLKRARMMQNYKGAQSTIIACPSASWARIVYPELSETEGIEKLWEDVFHCCRINEEDPIAAWDNYVANSKKRRKMLEAKNYQTFHYTSGKTDLYLSPTQPAMWMGGCADNPKNDDFFIPNVPTEEIFTCPHKYKSNGVVASTRPLNFNGKIINNFVLTLKDGRIIDYKAEQGQDVLESIIETDEGSHYFGEMALIDVNSPISSLNTVFYTTLFDENASCHIAIGRALGPQGRTPEEAAELDKQGFNASSLHVDFMVGSKDLQIKGLTTEGNWEDIFVDGSWTKEFTL